MQSSAWSRGSRCRFPFSSSAETDAPPSAVSDRGTTTPALWAGKTSESNAKRKAQAKRVAQVVTRLSEQGEKHVAVLGDLNDTPDSGPLAPLFSNTELRDISTHPKFIDDGRPGTYANGTKSNKIDYVLLSPALFSKVTVGAVFRKGVWGGKHGTLFPHYETMANASEAASDHAAIYADIDI